tara:strand:- start:10673 stop:11020 length:348 start_codon:yes stop_codon:yes gene_type:complete
MSKRVLIVEDEEDIREMYSVILEAKGYQVETAENGFEGKSLIDSRDYDIVLSDVNMPKCNGIELFKHWDSKGLDSKFIFVTGHARGSLEMKEIPKDIDILDKPISYDELYSIMEK